MTTTKKALEAMFNKTIEGVNLSDFLNGNIPGIINEAVDRKEFGNILQAGIQACEEEDRDIDHMQEFLEHVDLSVVRLTERIEKLEDSDDVWLIDQKIADINKKIEKLEQQQGGDELQFDQEQWIADKEQSIRKDEREKVIGECIGIVDKLLSLGTDEYSPIIKGIQSIAEEG